MKTFRKFFNDLVTEMAYPANFSHKDLEAYKSYKQKLAYAQTHLKRISSGSSRVVYQIDEEKVLKIAKNDKGLAQNAVESDWSLQNYSVIARTFENSEDFKDIGPIWLEMELAKKITPARFKSLTGIDINDLERLLSYNSSDNRKPLGRKLENRLVKLAKENEFYQEVERVVMDYDFLPGDYGKINSYGEVLRDGKPAVVVIDYGFSKFVNDNFYRKH